MNAAVVCCVGTHIRPRSPSPALREREGPAPQRGRVITAIAPGAAASPHPLPDGGEGAKTTPRPPRASS